MKYRSEIDGLRALAVLPVIFFHAGFTFFSGGFVGVDIFFVISGYLITTLIITELTNEDFSILNFYERRARRILPALFFIILVTLPLTWLWLSPNDFKDYGNSLISVVTFSSNILFWLESGYFDTAAELKPLLHTWSLAIEEQFYILFPLFLISTWRLGIKVVISILIFIFVISLISANFGAYSLPSATFYLLPTRAWELIVGVFIAFYLYYNEYSKCLLTNQIFSIIGLLMILYSIFTFNKTTPFPSYYALLPTMGTGLLILYATPGTIVFRILNLKLFVGIGLISYSIYLWHQPLLALAKHKIIEHPSFFDLIFIILISFIAAFLSWYFIEKPFRNTQKISSKKIFFLSGLFTLGFLVIGLLISTNYFKNKHYELPGIEYESLAQRINQTGYVCDQKEIQLSDDIYASACTIGILDKKPSVLLYGDSHAAAISYKLNEEFINKEISGVWVNGIKVGKTSCETTIFTNIISNENLVNSSKCSAGFLKLFEIYPVSNAIYVSRWTMKYYPTPNYITEPFFYSSTLRCKEQEDYREYTTIDENGIVENTYENRLTAITSFLQLMPSKINNILVYPIPETACNTYKLNQVLFSKNKKIPNEWHFPKSEYAERNEFVISAFDNYLKKHENFLPIRVGELFCNSFYDDMCSVIYNGNSLYLDDDHVSDYGAEIIVKKISEHIR